MLSELGLLSTDEAFTELYFPDHAALPDVVQEGMPIEFDFSIRNREGRTISYRWELRIGSPESSADDTVVAASGQVRLADGEVRSVHVEHVATGTAAPTSVEVVLVDRSESIRFPVTITPAESVAVTD